jgi:hypothetical protein
MQEATLSAMPNQIIRLFVTLLTFGDPADVEGLHHRHFDAMAEDQRDVTERQKQINIIHIFNLSAYKCQILQIYQHLLEML